MLWQLTWQKKSKRGVVGFTFSFIFAAAFSKPQHFFLAFATRLHLHISHLHCVSVQNHKHTESNIINQHSPPSLPICHLLYLIYRTLQIARQRQNHNSPTQEHTTDWYGYIVTTLVTLRSSHSPSKHLTCTSPLPSSLPHWVPPRPHFPIFILWHPGI